MRLNDGSLYFDCNATIPTKKRVLKALIEGEKFGFANPSSPYDAGTKAKEILEYSRKNILKKLAFEGELIFTSSATEANNLVVLSALKNPKVSKIVLSAFEHPSIYEMKEVVKNSGKKLFEIKVNKDGTIDLNQLEKTVSKGCFVSIMTAHNETGVVQPIKEIAKICQEKDALFHTDAVQGFGKINLNFGENKPNAITISSHKIGGPKGIGALAFDDKIKIFPMLLGGGQENGYRSSTECVPLIHSFSCAVDLIEISKFAKLKNLRDKMEEELSKKYELTIYGKNSQRLPNTSFFSVKNIDGRRAQKILNKEKIFIGTGSACHGAGKNLPKVLVEMGFKNESYPIRISFSSNTTKKDVDKFVDIFCNLF